MKKLAFVSLVAVALTGCVVTPYENGPRHSVYTGYDRGYSNYPYTVSRWENERRPVANKPPAKKPQASNPAKAKPVTALPPTSGVQRPLRPGI
ncbi:hypothetical protein [Acinetobacter indicus]|uniref:hypothetical protein n=1 Tax=Acinetobacter indicus TaxID=756892 RepID=UPI00144490CF|nr:hypothetical protein [Acinetobacter indicus]